ncbi:HEAT repeat domain-containing protein [Hoyosella rhizosphaerae]|uniref:HEAT repeat domain-containing protein n=1 Tax=Hoyosella rhizosphaerae TaxID=1755582 RepID=UPI001980136E|nr:HEAT repeat domain-containing protein [Hoyosella rhizosphaerae]MBN4926992.1 HEAT repeat domain-containing protein [Hoyosella rhizosphaerae]
MVAINTIDHNTPGNSLVTALSSPNSSTRLQAALMAGTHPAASRCESLVARCSVEPDFFVRDMLTWALTRHPRDMVVPLLVRELRSEIAQARSQSLHTLSKIGDKESWAAITSDLLHDADDEVARSAWRAAIILVPTGQEDWLAAELANELGRGDLDTQLSLSRALIAVGGQVPLSLNAATASADQKVQAHAIATEKLLADPDAEFAQALKDAKRVMITGVI